VAVNGYGTIGRRVADVVLKQPDMDLVGVTKATPDYVVEEALKKGIRIFSVNGRQAFDAAGYAVEGNVKDLLQGCDVVVDSAPKDKGRENLAIYSSFPELKAIFQGGEKHSLTNFSFNSDCNYEQALNRRFVRVVSCNTTGLCRVLGTINKHFPVKKVRATLVRRSADSHEGEKSIINCWQPDMSFPSHHSEDVKTVIPGLSITSLAGIAPMTLMHGHMLFIEPNGKGPAEAGEVAEILGQNRRILLCSSKKGLTSTARLKDLFTLNGRNGDLYEICVWNESIGVDDSGEIGLHMAIDQQADVIPENIDAIRAMFGTKNREDSIALTNSALGIGGQ